MIKYNQITEELMRIHFAGLSEPQRRQYAYIEAVKLGHGGKDYIGKLLHISYKAIRKGKAELNNPELLDQIPAGRQRRSGGGRKKFCPIPRNSHLGGSLDKSV
jgi:hypothetical protein